MLCAHSSPRTSYYVRRIANFLFRLLQPSTDGGLKSFYLNPICQSTFFNLAVVTVWLSGSGCQSRTDVFGLWDRAGNHLQSNPHYCAFGWIRTNVRVTFWIPNGLTSEKLSAVFEIQVPIHLQIQPLSLRKHLLFLFKTNILLVYQILQLSKNFFLVLFQRCKDT